MKEKLKIKYMPTSFSSHLIDNWHNAFKETNLPRSISRNWMNYQMQYYS